MEAAEPTVGCGEDMQDLGRNEGVWATDDFEDRVVEVGIVGADVCGLDVRGVSECVCAPLEVAVWVVGDSKEAALRVVRIVWWWMLGVSWQLWIAIRSGSPTTPQAGQRCSCELALLWSSDGTPDSLLGGSEFVMLRLVGEARSDVLEHVRPDFLPWPSPALLTYQYNFVTNKRY